MQKNLILVKLRTRMHLTQNQVKLLLPVLKYFAETGNYITTFNRDKFLKDWKKLEEGED